MRQRSLLFGAVAGALTSLPLIAISYLGEQFAGLPFLPFDLFDWLARVLPGDVIRLGIGTIVRAIGVLNLGPTSDAAKRVEQLMGLALVIAGGAVLGAVIAWGLQRSRRAGIITGAVALLPLAAIELDLGMAGNPVPALLWLAVLLVGWGAAVGGLLARTTTPQAAPTPAEPDTARRAALIKIAGGSIGVALGAWGLGRLLESQPAATGAGQPLANLRTATPEPMATATPAATPAGAVATPVPPTPLPQVTATATMRDRVQTAPGTRLELTPNEDFYRIDINTRPVVIDQESWGLRLQGLFDRPATLTLSDLMAYPAVTQPITLSCISNRIGGDLIGTSNWTGLRLRDLVQDHGLQPTATALSVVAADNFHESVTLEDVMDPRTLLVYGMNGETLPVGHGFPLRIYIPNRYGMKQPKWIVSLEAVDHSRSGYWVERGWSREARPQIVSVIDTVTTDAVVDGKVPIGGIAWAGDRGIQKVEVQVDDGAWVEAVLRTPPLGSLTWVQWRYDWPAVAGRHTFRVRATDGTGALQIEAQQDTFPDGATGYHSVTAKI